MFTLEGRYENGFHVGGLFSFARLLSRAPHRFHPSTARAVRVQASDHQGLQLGAHKEHAGAAVLERETAPKHAVVDRRSDR